MIVAARRLLFVIVMVVAAAILGAVGAWASVDGYSYDTLHPVHDRYDLPANLAPATVADASRLGAAEGRAAGASGPSLASWSGFVASRAPAVGDDFWRATNVGPNRAGTLVPESFDRGWGEGVHRSR